MMRSFACIRVLARSRDRRSPAWHCHAQAAGTVLLAVGLVTVVLVTGVPGPAAAQDAPSEPGATTPAPSSTGDGLLPLSAALDADGLVQVAGAIDHATLRQQQVDGSPGHWFELLDATGSRLGVAMSGDLPDGFEAAEVAVVSGSMADGRLLASAVLLAREPVPARVVEPARDPARGLTAVMVISLIVWAGLFIYVFRVDRRVHRMEVS